MALKFVDIEKSAQEKDDSRHNRRVMQFKSDVEAIERKFAGRGTSGAAEAKKQIAALADKVGKDIELGDLYGLDSPKSRSYGQKTQPKQGTLKKAKGGMIGGKKRYMNGGMVMSGRGVRDTKMS